LRTLFSHAADPDVALFTGANPCAKAKKFLAHEESRKRVLTREEAPKFFQELASEPNRDLRDFLLLALLTGARFTTLVSMRWLDVDLERGVWLIPNAKGRLGKEPQLTALVPMAVRILRSRPHVESSPWIFPSRGDSHVSTFKRPWGEFRKRAGLQDFVIHDLRRTHATAMGQIGASPDLIQLSLGHSEGSAATKIYNQASRHDDVADAVESAMTALMRTGKTSARKLLLARPSPETKK
jgi:integrase